MSDEGVKDGGVQYEQLVEDALRGVVRDVMDTAAKHGLLDKQHFYITFRTSHPKLRMPQWLLANHPDEMSIVLQHQYWDLDVSDEGFEVTLSFGGKPERLSIPFAAISAFSDPAAKFGLQFRLTTEIPYGEDDEFEEDDEAASPVVSDPVDAAEPAGGKVVALDAFRKK